MQLPDFLVQSGDGEICFAGHRIGLYHVVARYREGESAEMIAYRYPTLRLSLVHRVIAFYLDHQTEVDDYMASCDTELDRQQQEGPGVDLNELRRRLATQAGAGAKAE